MRTFRFVLLIAGLTALLGGIALVVMPRPAAPRLLDAPRDHDSYLGAETCYMCHPSVRRSHGLAGPGAAETDGTIPAAPASASTAGARVASLDTSPDTLTSQPPADTPAAARYVLQTERGYAILPGQWGMSDAGGAWRGECAGCHVVDRETGQRLLGGRDFTCETCHGPGGVHVEALVSPRISEQLRRLSAPDADRALCRACHAGEE